MIRAIPSCMLYTLIIHMDASFVYRGCEPTLLYIGGFYFSTLGNASAYPVHPVSDGGLKNFSFITTSAFFHYCSLLFTGFVFFHYCSLLFTGFILLFHIFIVNKGLSQLTIIQRLLKRKKSGFWAGFF